MGDLTSYLLEMVVTLVAVGGLAFVILYGTRRLGMGRPHGPIRLCGKLALDARRSIVLVEVGCRVLIVGVGEGGFTKLGEVESEALGAAIAPRSTSFGDVLARTFGKRTPRPNPNEPGADA